MENEKETVVNAKRVLKRYKDVTAVDAIDLSIGKGEILGLLGPNGAGKTTFINVMLGLTSLDGGEISVFGLDIKKHALATKRRIGLVPQEIAVFDDLTGEENVAFFGRLYGLSGEGLKRGVREVLDFTGLLDRRKKKPNSYSGGMKRRLNIACALVHRPELIILDEPTVGIDPQSRNHILDAVRMLNENGATVIYTSHYMEEVEALCSRIAIIDRGRVIASGTQSDLKDLVGNEEMIDIVLDVVTPRHVSDLECIAGVSKVVIDDDHLRLTVERNAVRLGRIIEKLSAAGADVKSISVEQPSLESVFLSLTGRRLRE